MNRYSERFRYLREMPRHLRELGLLVGRPVNKGELLSLSDTEAVRARASEIARTPISQAEMLFDEKQTPRFAQYVRKLEMANPSDVYLWIPTTTDCGFLRPVPLNRINFQFPFDLNPDGIVTILTRDLQDRLVLDYSLGDFDERLLEVEVSGRNWGRIQW